MPRTKGSKNRPKTNNDYASQITEKQESITYVLHQRCPKAVFSHDEAFYYHDLTDSEPMIHTAFCD